MIPKPEKENTKIKLQNQISHEHRHKFLKKRKRKSKLNPTIHKKNQDFPGGTVVKNPPANAGDTGSSPGRGRFPHATEQLRLCATTTEARAPRTHALQQEKPPQ